MTEPRNADIDLEMEELPDGVRYVLPRRRRRGWAALVWHAAVAFFFYFTIPIVLVWAVVYQNAPWWFFAVGLGAVLLFFLGGLSNIRNAWAILSTPDVAIELRPGRIVIIRQTLAGIATKEVPVADVRRMTVRCLLPAEDASPPSRRREWSRRWQQWFSAFPLEEMERAERRQGDALRYFGTLVLEGEAGAEIALAEEYGLTCLMRLAKDLACRLNRECPQVSVEQCGHWPTAIFADDPRLIRPAHTTNIKTDRSAETFVFEVPPPGVSYSRLLGGAVGAALALVVAGWLAQTVGWPPALTDLGVLFFVSSLLAISIGAVRIGVRDILFGAARTAILVGRAGLTVRWCWPVGRRERAWTAGQVAACFIQQRFTANNAGKTVLTYDLVMLDQAMRGFVLLRDRPEAELEWVATVLHKELGLGRRASQPSVPEQDTVKVN
jgi:hypothetical protein